MNKIAAKRLKLRISIALGTAKETVISRLFYDSFLWNIYCFIRKQGRFIKRLFIWTRVLYKDEDWDFTFLLNILHTKLKGMYKAQKEDLHHTNAPKCARQILEVMGHIERYRDIDKYTLNVPADEYLSNTKFIPADYRSISKKFYRVTFTKTFPFVMLESTSLDIETPYTYRMVQLDKAKSKRHTILHNKQTALEQYHWNQIWLKIAKNGRNWWT